jgi:ABC-2 type transport system permease protein
MTTTLDRPLPQPATVGVGNVVASEWLKLRSVRSTYWTLIAAILAAVGLGAAICAGYVARYSHVSPADRLGFEPVTFSLNGLYIAQVAIGALGVLVISSEYTTGMIRTTLSAVPQRRLVLATKAAVFGAVALVCGEIMSFAAFGIGQAILAQRNVGASLGDPHVLRAVIGGGLYLTAVGLLGVGLGALIRHTAGALSALFGVMFATSVIVALLPTSWRNHVMRYLPINAGTQIMSVQGSHDMLGPWAGLGVLLLYAAIALGVGALLLVGRDA